MKKKKKDIRDELRDKTPFLSGKMQERKGGFKVPKGYLESLTERTVKRVEDDRGSKEELRELSPLLAERLKDKKGGLTPPIGYFDNLADRLEQGAAPPTKVRSIGSNWARRLVAASVLLFVIAGLWFILPNNKQNILAQLEGYNEVEVLDYLDQNMDEFDLNDLLESGLISNSDIDFRKVSELSDEETDLYINSILYEDEI